MSAHPKRQSKEEIERQILDISVPLVREKGYRNLTIRSICEHAGITTGMFYRHFSSKDDLLSFAYIDLVNKTFDQIDKKIKGKELPDQLVTISVELMKCNVALGRDSIFVFLNTTNPACDCTVSRNVMYEKIRLVIEQAKSDGFALSKGRSADAIFDDFLIILKGINYDWYSKGDAYDPIKSCRAIFKRVINSLI